MLLPMLRTETETGIEGLHGISSVGPVAEEHCPPIFRGLQKRERSHIVDYVARTLSCNYVHHIERVTLFIDSV